MFEGCSSLNKLNFSKFNVNTVKEKKDMFIRCSVELTNRIKEENKYFKDYDINSWGLGIGDWGIGDWGLGPIPNPQSPIPIRYSITCYD